MGAREEDMVAGAGKGDGGRGGGWEGGDDIKAWVPGCGFAGRGMVRVSQLVCVMLGIKNCGLAKLAFLW